MDVWPLPSKILYLQKNSGRIEWKAPWGFQVVWGIGRETGGATTEDNAGIQRETIFVIK